MRVENKHIFPWIMITRAQRNIGPENARGKSKGYNLYH